MLQKPFNQPLLFVNLYQNGKYETVTSICPEEMLDLKIPQSEWLRTFCPISEEQIFSQTEDLYRYTANNINFHYRTNSWKINCRIFLKN